MSLRPAPWPLFGGGAARRTVQDDPNAPSKPDLKLVEGGGAPRLERMSLRARFVTMALVVSLALFGVVAFHVVLSQGQFKLAKLQAKADAAQNQYSRLRLQVAQLESPSRITSEAQNRLGMVPPEKVTPVSPAPGDMPHGTISQSGPTAPPTTADAGEWNSVKPHLSSSAK